MFKNPITREVGCLLLTFLRSVQVSWGDTSGAGSFVGTIVGMIFDGVTGKGDVLPLEGDILLFERFTDAALTHWPTS